MFCFGKGGAEMTQDGAEMTQDGAESIPPSDTIEQVEWNKAEDVISDISSDGKYEIDIPTVKEFSLANIENVKYIDNDNDTESDDDNTQDTISIAESINDSLIRDTMIKIAPSLTVTYPWLSNKAPIIANGSSTNNNYTTTISLQDNALNKELMINSLNENNAGNNLTATPNLSERLRNPNMFARQESDDLTDNASFKQDPLQPPPGPRFKLLLEGDIQLCQFNHTRTLINKILTSKFLRRWDTHHLYLGDLAISSKTPNIFLEPPLPYTSIVEVYNISHWDSNQKYCLRIVVKDGSLLLQTNNAYSRDQWFHSIQWKKNLHKFRNILSNVTSEKVILKELKNLVDYVLTTPLQDESITSEPLDIISKLFSDTYRWCDSGTAHEEALQIVSPLLATSPLPPQLSTVLTNHCKSRPHSPRLRDTMAQVASRILKHNVDFGKATHSRKLVQEYISALYNQSEGEEVVRNWVHSVHGHSAICPHPRVLPNLASACLAALHQTTTPSNSHIGFNACPTPITVTPATISLPTTPITPMSPVMSKISTSDIFIPKSSLSHSRMQFATLHQFSEDNETPTDNDQTPPDDEHLDKNGISSEDVKKNLLSLISEVEKNELNICTSKNISNGYKSEGELNVPQIIEPKESETGNTDGDELVCFANVIKFMSEYTDWAESLGALLQPVPVPSRALHHPVAGNILAKAAGHLGRDPRCSVHSRVLSLRPPRPGWFELLCPTVSGVQGDHLHLWGDMLETLLNCCCKRKKFLTDLTEMLPACLLLALRAHPAGLQSLCLMLEWELLNDEQQRLDTVQALQTSAPGRRALQSTCKKQVHLKKLQQKGGPRRLTLPSKATDADVARLLSAGSFGNLECLSLAFTHVTSAVAEQLIKLPSLRYLNLWATQFGDAGVMLIAEHLQNLQVLNLCETPVSDRGISALAALPRLKKLNLNSTKLTAGTWNRLRQSLPALQESDVKYTDAW